MTFDGRVAALRMALAVLTFATLPADTKKAPDPEGAGHHIVNGCGPIVGQWSRCG